MRISVTIVTTLALATLGASSALPSIAQSNVAITAGSEVTDSSLISADNEVYRVDDFIGTPEEIYMKVNATLAAFGLDKRGEDTVDSKIWQPLCTPIRGWSWKAASVNVANACRDTMGKGGRFTVGPHSCAKVCCISGNGVFLCNDNPGPISPALPYLQSYVGNIIDHCGFDGGLAGRLAGGQIFDTDNYNIILRGNNGLASDCNYLD